MNAMFTPVLGQCVSPDCRERVCSVYCADIVGGRPNSCANCYCSAQSHELLGHMHEGVVQLFPKVHYVAKVFSWEKSDAGTSTVEDSVVETETTMQEDEDGNLFELTKTRFVYNTPSRKRTWGASSTLCASCEQPVYKKSSSSSSSAAQNK